MTLNDLFAMSKCVKSIINLIQQAREVLPQKCVKSTNQIELTGTGGYASGICKKSMIKTLQAQEVRGMEWRRVRNLALS